MARIETDRMREEFATMAAMTPEQLTTQLANSVDHVAIPLEMGRRLLNALDANTGATVAAGRSADRWARRLLFATWVLALLTVAIVVLSAVLIARG